MNHVPGSPANADDEQILIHGGNNQVAQAIIEALEDQGERVVVVSRSGSDRTDSSSSNARWLSGLTDTDQACSSVHTLIWIGPFEPLESVMGMLGSLSRVIAFSSSSLDNKADSADIHEQHVLSALKDGETQVRLQCDAAEIAWTVFRPTLIYGLGRDRNLTRFANLIDRFGVIALPMAANGLRQPVHVMDLACAVLAVIQQSSICSGVYSLGGGDRLSYREMVARIFVSLDRPVRIIVLPMWMLRCGIWFLRRRRRFDDVNAQMLLRMSRDLIVDHQAAVRDLAYQPRPFKPDRQTWQSADDVRIMALSLGSE